MQKIAAIVYTRVHIDKWDKAPIRCICANVSFQIPSFRCIVSDMDTVKKQIARIVLVSGAPGAGKTTLAVPLALELGFPIFSKDFIKETLFDVFGSAEDSLEYSRKIGGAAMELIWSLASYAPCAVLEANFRPKSIYEIKKIRGLNAKLVEVYCDCGPSEAARRFKERAAAEQHHAAHPLKELPQGLLDEYDRPLNVGRLVEVDTKRPVAAKEVAKRVLSAFETT